MEVEQTSVLSHEGFRLMNGLIVLLDCWFLFVRISTGSH